MTEQINIEQDRRQAVRITDRVLFSYSMVQPDRYTMIYNDFLKGIPPYKQQEYAYFQMYIGAQSALVKLRERDEVLADLLQHMDNKINQVLDRLREGDSPFNKLRLQEINFSSDGLAFFSGQDIKPGTLLEYNIVLLPDYTYIYCFAEVVSSDRDSGLPAGAGDIFRVSSKFTMLMEEDREKLIQHNFKQQSRALRQRRRG